MFSTMSFLEECVLLNGDGLQGVELQREALQGDGLQGKGAQKEEYEEEGTKVEALFQDLPPIRRNNRK